MHAGAQCVTVAGLRCHLQCLQEVTVERRKERSRAAPTIDMMGERKGCRGHLNSDIMVMHIILMELELVVCNEEK